MLESLDGVKDIHWLRLRYCYPRSFPERLLRFLADSPKSTRYVDLPLQHINDDMLKRMQRGYKRQTAEKLIETLRERVPDITFRTSFIVGHPGETRAAFKELVDFLEKTHLNHVVVFKYSDEKGTAAYEQSDKCSTDEINERYASLNALQNDISHKINKTMIGQTCEVLVEGHHPQNNAWLTGRTAGMAPTPDGRVVIRKGMAEVGSFVPVIIREARSCELFGEIAQPASQ